MHDSFVKALENLAESDPRIILITGDLGFRVLNSYSQRFPDQFVNAGVAEQNMTAMACGMALSGARVFTYSIGNFPTLRCMEQLRNDVCYHRADVVVVAVGGGFSYGKLGMSHFATEDLAMMRTLPEMTVVAPSDPWQADVLTRQMQARGGPGYLRLEKGGAGLASAPEAVKLGEARVVRGGGDVAIFAIGPILGSAVKAADLLAQEGISTQVVEIHTLKPFDQDTIARVSREVSAIITLEEHSVIGGLGGAVAEACLEAGSPPRLFLRIGIADKFSGVVGDQNYLRRLHGLDAESVKETVVKLLRTKP
ncbi:MULTISPECIES: transketolase family protein [unclassified Bradyrhizobium]|uniref:transketolase family protein n=1 Tax=unclassified Bradyrhizobium TaxID=2631580 RepID=UPI0028F1098B|nr:MULTISPECIES: transketolase C-terminal domain-containing protein [unclassified Bradyrhizobium]